MTVRSDEQTLELQFDADGREHVATVRHQSDRMIEAELEDPPRVGATTELAVLVDADGLPAALPPLRVERVSSNGHASVIALAPTSDRARARLWYALHELARDAEWPSPNRDLGDVAAHDEIPARGVYTEAARLERLSWLRCRSGEPLEGLDRTRLDPTRLTGNLENMIGAVEVPVGLAGPLLFCGSQVRGSVCAPLATTEGALVASAARGATAISRSGGVVTHVLGQRMMRVPAFDFDSLREACVFASWVRDREHELRQRVSRVSSHATLIGVDPVVLGRTVHVVFNYETGDASGQNMTTACTWDACQWLLDELRALDVTMTSFLIEGNMSSDKKVSHGSFIGGRGIRVAAECELTGDATRRVLKVDPDHLERTHARGQAASVHIGMLGYNANAANVIAGMFTALGQDIACVHESSIGQLQLEAEGDTLRATLVLPALIVGTVGGGTHLPAQRDLLDMLGCDRPGTASRLAEIVAGFVLALDLSTIAAVAGGQFASAHERLGRNRPVNWFTERDLTAGFFEPGLRGALDEPHLDVTRVQRSDSVIGSSVTSELTAQSTRKLVGMLPMRLSYRTGAVTHELEAMVKVKPLDAEIELRAIQVASACGPRVARAVNQFCDRLGYRASHLRELAIYELDDRRLRSHLPRAYGVHRDDEREAYVLVLERLTEAYPLDGIDESAAWAPELTDVALHGLGEFHAARYGRADELLAEPWIGWIPSSESMIAASDLFRALADHAAAEFPHLVSTARHRQLLAMVESLPEWWPEIEAMPRTLIHNDFTPRNVTVRGNGGDRRMCCYDLELATIHIPQRDLAEFLAFTLDARAERSVVDRHLETHRRSLASASGHELDPAVWRAGYCLALRDLAISRFGLYHMAHTVRSYDFTERSTNTLWRLLEIEGERHR
jgi:hydroxymethylglutaryl-CoA reductase (NADPH)